MTTPTPASTGRLSRLITPRTVIVAVLALFLTGVVMIRGADAVDDKTVTAHFPGR